MSEVVAQEQSTDPSVELPPVESIKLEGAVLDPVSFTNEQEFNGCRGVTLENLPYELLLLVFNYVDAGHLIRSVSKVCQKFHVLLSSETYWKTRLTAWYSPNRYPPVSGRKFHEVGVCRFGTETNVCLCVCVPHACVYVCAHSSAHLLVFFLIPLSSLFSLSLTR